MNKNTGVQKMKTKKLAQGWYQVNYNNKKFEIENVETQFGMEWELREITLVQPLPIREFNQETGLCDGKIVEGTDKPYEENEWVTTLDTLKECKEVILENY